MGNVPKIQNWGVYVRSHGGYRASSPTTELGGIESLRARDAVLCVVHKQCFTENAWNSK